MDFEFSIDISDSTCSYRSFKRYSSHKKSSWRSDDTQLTWRDFSVQWEWWDCYYRIVYHSFWKHRSERSISESAVQDCFVRWSSLSFVESSSTDLPSSISWLTKVYSQRHKISVFVRSFFHDSGHQEWCLSERDSNCSLWVRSEFPSREGNFFSLSICFMQDLIEFFFCNHEI